MYQHGGVRFANFLLQAESCSYRLPNAARVICEWAIATMLVVASDLQEKH